MTMPLTARQRIALARRFSGLRIEVRSISEARFSIASAFVSISRPAFNDRLVGSAYMTGSMRHPPSDHEVWALRVVLTGWIDGGLP